MLNLTTLLAGFNLDSFRMVNLWLTLAISAFVIKACDVIKKENNEDCVCV